MAKIKLFAALNQAIKRAMHLRVKGSFCVKGMFYVSKRTALENLAIELIARSIKICINFFSIQIFSHLLRILTNSIIL